jgi:hypothetical protein
VAVLWFRSMVFGAPYDAYNISMRWLGAKSVHNFFEVAYDANRFTMRWMPS